MEGKFLNILSCKECPFFNPQPVSYSDDQYMAVCDHPNGDRQWLTKIRNHVEPPSFCPLPNAYEKLENQ